MLVVSICQEMGWTYFDYMIQPAWFLTLLRDKIVLDSEARRKETKNYGK